MAARYYLGIAEPLPENWSISFPAFPGTVTTGQGFAELMTNARDALASVVAAMQEDGEPIPDSVEAVPELAGVQPGRLSRPAHRAGAR